MHSTGETRRRNRGVAIQHKRREREGSETGEVPQGPETGMARRLATGTPEMTTLPLTPRQCAAVLAVLTTLATVTAALQWGTGCATTPNDCMVVATCANQRLIKSGVESRIAIVSIDTLGDHGICVWRMPHNGMWIYDGQGSYPSGAIDFADTNALAASITCRHLLPTRWVRWVAP